MGAPVDELLDVLDDNGNPTEERKPRSAVHRDGDWHRAFHLWVVREGHLIVLQRRAEVKDLEPLRLDVTVGGHYRAGEMFVDVLREAEEEIGLVLRPGQVAFLGTVRSERHYPELDPPRVDREFQEIYATHDDRPLSAYVQEPEEVDTLYEVPLDGAIALYREGRHVAAAGFDAMRRVSNALLVEDDVIAQGRSLTAQALERVQRWANGEDADALAELPFEGPPVR